MRRHIEQTSRETAKISLDGTHSYLWVFNFGEINFSCLKEIEKLTNN